MSFNFHGGVSMAIDDDPDAIPSIVPSRDEGAASGRPGGSGGSARRAPRRERSATARKGNGDAGGGGSARDGSSLLMRLLVTVSMVVALIACAWAWQLGEKLTQATFERERYAKRISDLEDRLADTDQGLSQNTAQMAVKIEELYSEVDKLWASAWRRNKAAIEELQGTSVNLDKKIASLDGSISSTDDKLGGLMSDVSKLKSVAGDLERVMSNARSNQASMERVADTVNKLNLDIARLSKRVASNEEWVESINNFRRQVNGRISELQSMLRSLQQSGA